jgi:hypothetical protein
MLSVIGSCRKDVESHCILQENNGNRWNVEIVFFSVDFYQLPILSSKNRPEFNGRKSEKFLTGIPLLQNHWN